MSLERGHEVIRGAWWTVLGYGEDPMVDEIGSVAIEERSGCHGM